MILATAAAWFILGAAVSWYAAPRCPCRLACSCHSPCLCTVAD